MLILDDLITSDFWRKNQVYWNKDENKLFINESSKLTYFNTTFLNLNILQSIEDRYYDTDYLIKIELFSSLKSSKLSDHWRKEILKQYEESVLRMKNIMNKVNNSFVIICTPNTSIKTHVHYKETQQTVTFVYNFLETSDNTNQSYFKFFNSDNIETHSIEIGKFSKELITWKDNVKHATNINCLSFFWVFDLTSYSDLNDINCNDVEILYQE